MGALGLALSLACGNAQQAPSRKLTTRSASTPPPATARATPRAAKAERARDFERRGVLDRAAGAYRELFQAGGDPSDLLSAAELYAQALALPFAAECYAELARFPEFASRAGAGSRRIAQIGAETYYDRETTPATEASLSRAHKLVVRGELAAARELLTAEELRSDRSALSLLGSVHWRGGDRVAAQRAWAQARGVSRMPLAAATVRALPGFHYAPTDFSFRDDELWFATSGLWLVAYDPRLRSFAWLDAQTGNVEQLAPHHDVPELWTFASVKSALPELAKKVTAIASRDGKRAAWLSAEQLTYFAPDRSERLEAVWKYMVPSAAPSRAKKQARPVAFTSAAFAPGSGETERLYVGQSDGTVRALSAAGKELFAFAAHDGEVTGLAVSNDGSLLATAGSDLEAHVWELTSPRRRITVEVMGEARSLHFFPDDDTLELAHSWEMVRYDARTGKERSRTRRGVEFLRVEHSADARWTAVGHYKTIALDVYEGTNTEPFEVTSSQVTDLSFALSRDQRLIALAAPTGVFAVELEPFRVVRLNETYATRAAISPSGRFIAAVHEDDVRIYPRAGGAPLSSIAFGARQPQALEFRSEAVLALLAHAESRTFNVSNGQARAPEPNTRRYPLAEGELVFGHAGLQRLTRTGRVAETIERVSPAIAVNSEGTHFAYQREGELVIRSADGSSRERVTMGYTPEQLALSSSGKRAAAVIFPSRLIVFDLGAGTQHELPAGTHGGLGGINAIAFYGENWVLASGTDGLLALDDRNRDLRGGLHLLDGGAWFSVVNRSFSTFVDGDESGIDASAAFPHGSPGLYWEGFRAEASFAQLLRGELPPDE